MSWTATILLHCAGCRDPPTTVCKAHPTLLRCSWCSQLWHHGQGSSQHDAALCPHRSRRHRCAVSLPPPPLSSHWPCLTVRCSPALVQLLALVEIRRYRVGALFTLTEISTGNPTIISGILASNIVKNTYFNVALAHDASCMGPWRKSDATVSAPCSPSWAFQRATPPSYLDSLHQIMCRSPILMLHWRMVRHAWGLV